MSTLKIICANKDFKLHKGDYVNNQYTVYTPNKILTDCKQVVKFNQTVDNRVWSEWAALKYILEHDADKYDWIQVNHYRRLITEYHEHVCCAAPITFNCSIAQQYSLYHNIEDLNLCFEIAAKLYPKMSNALNATYHGNFFIPYNIVQLPKVIFKDWATFVIKTLLAFEDAINCHTYKDFMDRVKSNPVYSEKNNLRNTDLKYAVRINAFLSERLTTAFFIKYMESQFGANMPLHYMSVNLLEKSQTI